MQVLKTSAKQTYKLKLLGLVISPEEDTAEAAADSDTSASTVVARERVLTGVEVKVSILLSSVPGTPGCTVT